MDENAPPGYFSPVGLLAGVRAMLLPGSGKDQHTQEAESPSRAVLRDMNTSSGPKPKSALNVTQGSGEGGGLQAQGADSPFASSPSQWQESGERTSIASDNSFVSALSGVSKVDIFETDFDSSTTSETGVESSFTSALGPDGSLSFLGDQLANLHLDSPSDFSSPRGGDSVQLSEADSSGIVHEALDETVVVSEASEQVIEAEPKEATKTFKNSEEFLKAEENLNKSETFVNETEAVSCGKLDFDATLEDDKSVCFTNETQVIQHDKPDLDETFEIGQGNIDGVNKTQIDSNGSSSDIRPSNADSESVQTINQSSSEPVDFNTSTEFPSQTNSIDNCTEVDSEEGTDALSTTFHGVSKSDLLHAAGVVEESEHYSGSSVPNPSCNSPTTDAVEHPPLKSGIPAEELTANQDSSSEPLVTEAVSDTHTGDVLSGALDAAGNSPVDFQAVGSELTSAESLEITSSGLNIIGEVEAEKSLKENVSHPVEAVPSVNASYTECEVVPEEGRSTSSDCFDEAPLPARKPRTFEEILAEELAANGIAPEPEPSTKDETLLSSQAQILEEPKCEEPHTDLENDCCGGSEVAEPTEFSSQFSSPEQETIQAQEPDDVPIPIKAPRSFEEILEAELAQQGDPEHAVPKSALDELPIPIKAPRTFEEILAAELAAQDDPEQAVPSFSNSPRKSVKSAKISPKKSAGSRASIVPTSPSKLDESFANIISSSTSPLELESEPELVLDSAPLELESGNSSGLDSLIEKCKEQESLLEEQEPRKVLVTDAGVASPFRSTCFSDSQTSASDADDLVSPDAADQTVIMLEAHSSPDDHSSDEKAKVECSPLGSVAQAASQETLQAGEQEISLGQEEFQSGDLFRDPSAFDFLSLHGCHRTARDLRKESLYVKFDPLVGSLSDSRIDSSTIMHPDNSTESQTVATGAVQATPAHLESEKLVSFSPAVPSKQPQDKGDSYLSTPVKAPTNRSSPVKTPAHVMLNETLESIGSRGTLVKQEDLIKKLQEHQSVLEEQDRAYQEKISDLEQRLQEMDIQRSEEFKEKDKQIQEKEKLLQEKVQSLGELNVIMKEYEKTISRLVAEKSQEKAALEEKQVDLIKDRDQAQQHLNNMEIAFADIHTKYERLKNVVAAFKKNEETLNAALAEKQEDFDKMQNMYDMLKSHAVSKLEKANQELEAMKQKHQQENAKLKAMVKKLEIKTKSLEEALEQKVKENQALTAICDELINKVGE